MACVSGISALGRQRQGQSRAEDSLDYIVSSTTQTKPQNKTHGEHGPFSENRFGKGGIIFISFKACTLG